MVQLLQELYRIHEGRSDLPLMAYGSYGGWNVWTSGQANYCLRRGLSVVAEAWMKEGKGENTRLVPEEFVLHSGGATRMPGMGASPLVIQRAQCVYGVREG